MKTITVTLNTESIREAIDQLNEFMKQLEESCDGIAKALSEHAAEVAQSNFSTAIYDGDNDVEVSIEKSGDSGYDVVASGTDGVELFIEYGTGVIYPDGHPERVAGIAGRGQYGKNGANVWGWTYSGNPGTNGMIVSEGKGKGKVHTFGNPSNMCMYNAKVDTENSAEEIAKGVIQI